MFDRGYFNQIELGGQFNSNTADGSIQLDLNSNNWADTPFRPIPRPVPARERGFLFPQT